MTTPPRPVSGSSSPNAPARGNEALTRTTTGSSVSISRREPTWQFTHPPTSPTSPPSSTNAPGKGTATTPRHSVSPKKQPPHQPAEIASQARSKCPHDTHVLHRLIESARGFERYYGFLGGETNQWYPDLVYDNHPVQQPKSPEEGYHLTVDLTDRAIEFVQDAKAIAPDKPIFLYYCPGAAHAPHHAPKEWADKYRGKFDMGYEAYREQVFQRQQQLGIIPEGAELSPINPYTETTSHDGRPWSQLDRVRPWASLSGDEQRLFARMAEVYAGFLSHADHQLGRLLDYLEESGQLDNTIIVLVSDNGASGEGGPNGSVNENKFFNGVPDTIEENLRYLDELGGPTTYNHYPNGWAWAFNTPFKLWKRYANYEGGTADPLIVSWPQGIAASAGLRRQYCHAVDIVPTLLECLGVA